MIKKSAIHDSHILGVVFPHCVEAGPGCCQCVAFVYLCLELWTDCYKNYFNGYQCKNLYVPCKNGKLDSQSNSNTGSQGLVNNQAMQQGRRNSNNHYLICSQLRLNLSNSPALASSTSESTGCKQHCFKCSMRMCMQMGSV